MQYEIAPEKNLSLSEVADIIHHGRKLVLSDSAATKIEDCRNYLDNRMSQSAAPIYGINTGFGALCNTIINDDELELLQKNLLYRMRVGWGRKCLLK